MQLENRIPVRRDMPSGEACGDRSRERAREGDTPGKPGRNCVWNSGKESTEFSFEKQDNLAGGQRFISGCKRRPAAKKTVIIALKRDSSGVLPY